MFPFFRPGFLAALLALLGACSDELPQGGPVIDSTVVASADVWPSLDPARTYEYEFSEVKPESVLVALWQDGLPVVQAWLPIDYACEDVLGPRLTVELDVPDDRMAFHDFQLGTGRLACATLLKRYAVLSTPGAFRVDATVRFVELEGGCWWLAVSDSTGYEPLGLPREFRVNGLAIRATLRRRDDMASICMIGPIAEVLQVERR